jgi:hypothetical protein
MHVCQGLNYASTDCTEKAELKKCMNYVSTDCIYKMNVFKHICQDINTEFCTYSQPSIKKCMNDCAVFGIPMCSMRQNRPPIRTKTTGLMRHTLTGYQPFFIFCFIFTMPTPVRKHCYYS